MEIEAIVWDNIGNVLSGVRAWDEWPPYIQAHLLREDPDARAHAPALADMFSDHHLTVHEAHSLEDVERHIQDADFLVVHKERLPAATLERAGRLRLLQHLGHDYRGLPLAAARQMGVPVAAVPLINYWAVAEQAWATILEWAKRLREQEAHMAARAYADTWGTYPPGLLMVQDLTLGLVGLGEIGRAMAQIGAGLGLRMQYWDRERFQDVEDRWGLTWVPWETLFRTSDVLSVHLPITPDTERSIGAREFGWMKPTAYFVNTARGKLVDQPALVEALGAATIGGAALDVYAEEPLPPDDPLHDLWARPDVRLTLTPHSAWQSPWTWIRDSQAIWQNVRNSLDGVPLRYLVGDSESGTGYPLSRA
jgi:phosphoglycerate dehydrogenase-like enzyme